MTSEMDMVERGARAICIACGEDPDTLVLRMESLPERVSIPRWQSVAHDARAALSAALDPEDEALVELMSVAAAKAKLPELWSDDPREAHRAASPLQVDVLREIHLSVARNSIRAAIAALKAAALGEKP